MKILRSLFSHPLISGSSIVFIGSMAVNVLNYIFYLTMGRLLSVSDYGLLVTLISSLALFGIFTNAFTGVIAKFVAQYTSRNDTKNITLFLGGATKFISFFSIGLIVLLIILFPAFANFLHILDFRLLFSTYLLVIASILTSVYIGLLQGQLRFYLLSFINFLGPFLKIIFSLLATVLYFKSKLLGVIYGTVLASFIPIALGYLLMFRKLRLQFAKARTFFTDVKQYGASFFLSSISITIFTSVDIILIRHFFPSHTAGLYAALSLMGKAIFYVTSPIYFVFFPLIAQKKEKKEKVLGTLLLAIGIVCASSISLSAMYFLFPQFVLHVFFPKGYEELIPYLGLYSLYIFIFSIAWLFNNYFLSLGKTDVYKINIFCAALFVILLFLFHTSLMQVILVMFFVALVLLSLLLIYLRYYERH